MTNKNVCEVFCYDEDKVERLQKEIETVDITGMSQMLKAIADKNRAKITYILCQDDELCVCDIALILDITIANTSHHLRTLYKEGIVTSRKEGKLVFYSLKDPNIKQLITFALAHQERVTANV